MKKKIFYLFILLPYLFTGCKKDFLERPSKSNPTLETYYTNAEQVNGATGILYNVIWYDYIDKAYFAIGEVLSGNMWAAGSDFNSFKNFTVSGTDQAVANSWTAFYKAAGTATVLMNTFEDKKKTVSGDVSYLDQGIAESRFIRAAAYFYLTRTFGAVPIVTDPVKMSEAGNFNVPRYKQEDVLKFILEDLKYAEEHLSPTAEAGRVTSYSATGMMAKVYLYMKDYENAKKKAFEVIDSKKYSLYPDYYKMFSSSTANNNEESLFALQWLAAGGYSIGNAMQTYIGPSTLMNPIAGGGGYSLFIPSIDLIRSYEPGDKRREWSIMEHGFTRTDWTSDKFPNGYFVYDTAYVSSADQASKIKTPTRSNSLKYIVGTDPGGGINSAFTSMNTYVLRYADVLLIYAEAILGNSASTTDADALKAFNDVRHRAGFDPSEDKTSLTIDDILHERRVEFAFEGDFWYDIQRMGYDKAKVIIGAQERGIYSSAGTHKVDHFGVALSSPSQLFLPIPSSEVLTNPELGKEPVPYY